MKRGALSAAAGCVMALFGTTAITWFVSIKSAGLPLWPIFVFLVITAGGFYGMLAPLRNWPPFKPEPVAVPAEHGEQLRNIAQKLRGQISDEKYPRYSESSHDPEFLEAVFAAHFPRIHSLVASFTDQSSQWEIARAQYLRNAGLAMLKRFREEDGWDLDEIRARFRTHQLGIAEGSRGPELEEIDGRKAVTWDGKVIFRTKTEPSPELLYALSSAAISVREWVDEARHSEEAETMRAMQPLRKKSEAAALLALEPVVQYQQIFAADGCEICTLASAGR